MLHKRVATLVQILITAALVSCTTTGFHDESFPLNSPTQSPGVPLEHEVQLALEISRENTQEDYLVVMRTEKHRFTMVFLTPQGLPVYRLALENNALQISRQMVVGELLDPLQILRYLKIAYLADENIPALMRTNWHLYSAGNRRVFSRQNVKNGAGQCVTIEYTGNPPWYSSILLTDTQNAISLNFRILDVATVLLK